MTMRLSVVCFTIASFFLTASVYAEKKQRDIPPAYVKQVVVSGPNRLGNGHRDYYSVMWKSRRPTADNKRSNATKNPVTTRTLSRTKRARPLPRKGLATVTVTFSARVISAHIKVGMVNSIILPLKKKDNTRLNWGTTFDIAEIRARAGDVARVPLSISGTDIANNRDIDGNPATIAQLLNDNGGQEWIGYERRPDATYWLRTSRVRQGYDSQSFHRVGRRAAETFTINGRGDYTHVPLDVAPHHQIVATLTGGKLDGTVDKFQIRHKTGVRGFLASKNTPISKLKKNFAIGWTNNSRETLKGCVVAVLGRKAKAFELTMRLFDRGDLGTRTDAGDVRLRAIANKDFSPASGLDISWGVWHTAHLYGDDTVDCFRVPNVPKGARVRVELRKLNAFKKGARRSIKVRVWQEIYLNGISKRVALGHPKRDTVELKSGTGTVLSRFYEMAKACNVWFRVETPTANANVKYEIRVTITANDDGLAGPPPIGK